MTLHIAKLCVGVADVAMLRRLQVERLAAGGTLRHRTRNFPRRAAEIVDGGSLYWVIAGTMAVRQRILDIDEERNEDGTGCAALVLDPDLVPLAGRAVRPFQGWRYLEAAAAPPDLDAIADDGQAALPASLRRELKELGLL